jgi:hypothetical protein
MDNESNCDKRQKDRERERFDSDTRIFRAHAYTRSLSQIIIQPLTPKHTRRMGVCFWAFAARACLRYCLKGEQPPSASVYGQGTLARHPRADSGNIKASGCAALWAHQRMSACR